MNPVPNATNATNAPTIAARPQSAESEVCEGLVRERAALLRTALRRTGNLADAEDLVQETTVRALRFAGSYRAGTNVGAWLQTILRNTSINRAASERLRPKTFGDADVGAAILGRLPSRELSEPVTGATFAARREDFDGALFVAIQSLPATYRDVLLLSVLEDLRHREIADRLGIAEGTVMSRLFRARRLVRETLTAKSAA